MCSFRDDFIPVFRTGMRSWEWSRVWHGLLFATDERNWIEAIINGNYWITSFRPRPHLSVFVWKRNIFFTDWLSVHTYPVKTVTENATFRKRSPEWTFLCFRVDGENGTFRKRWRHSVGSRLPCERSCAKKNNLNAKWRRILCYKKIQNIGLLCRAWFPVDIFEV